MVMFRALLLSVFACASVYAQSPAPAEPPASTTAAPTADSSVDAILKRSAEAVQHPEQVAGSGWQEHADAVTKQQIEQNADVLKSMQQNQQNIVRNAINDTARQYNLPGLATTDKKSESVHYRIFASQSLGENGLREIFEVAALHPDLVVSFRGMKPGQTLRDMSELLGKLLHKVAPDGAQLPAIEINPPAFADGNVTEAPTLEKLDKGGHALAVVRGVTDPDWIDKQVAGKKTGDLGKRGEVFPVVEEDMLAKLQQAAKSFDYHAWADKAGQAYWDHVPFVDLPPATQARQRSVDPTIEVKDDIVTPDGQYIAHKGDRFNPLTDGPGFHQTVLVFDGSDAKQVEFVAKFVKANADKKVTLITTGIDRHEGWEGFNQLQNKAGRAVYLLNSVFQDTFHIEHVPSIVSAKDATFIVTEVPVHQGGAG